jgi:hypothetical protein
VNKTFIAKKVGVRAYPAKMDANPQLVLPIAIARDWTMLTIKLKIF